jgi:Proteolipid membrane potential modulator
MDCILNTILFIAGVIPGHIHGFYITCTYFRRKRKVRKGRYPGGRKAGIFSDKVWNGGASNEEVRDLLVQQQRREQEEEEARMLKRGSKRSSGLGLGRMTSTRGTGSGRSVAASDVVMYDGEERRPVERAVSGRSKPMREVRQRHR